MATGNIRVQISITDIKEVIEKLENLDKENNNLRQQLILKEKEILKLMNQIQEHLEKEKTSKELTDFKNKQLNYLRKEIESLKLWGRK